MSEAKCRRCGMEVSPEAAQGLCPRCLLEAGLESEPRAGGGPGASSPGTELSLEAVARDFPQLEILEVLGRGGMGTVYKARQPSLDRVVALKILSPRLQDDPAFAERFSREARALARLSHPNIVTVYDFGEASGRFYFLMEYVDGIDLRQALLEGKFSPEEALAVVPRLCEALQYAHDEGVVHRDIKPENILIDRRGRVKIADFGLAKLAAPAARGFTLTGTRDVLGTPHYMAPEQLGRTAAVDHRADIYALGVVFYEMLTGELPVGRFAPPSRKVAVDVRLDEVVLRSLENEPARRYQSARDLKSDVEAIAAAPAPGGSAGSARNAAGGSPEGAAPAGGASFGDTKTRPSRPTPEQVAAAREQIHGPALGLLLGAFLDFIALPLFFVLDQVLLPPTLTGRHGSFLNPWRSGSVHGYEDMLLVLFLASALIGVFLARGAMRMLMLSSQRSAIDACFLGMLPFHPGFLAGFPAGVTGLLRVTRPDVASAFREGEEEKPRPAWRAGRAGGGAAPPRRPIVITGRAVLAAAGVALAVFVVWAILDANSHQNIVFGKTVEIHRNPKVIDQPEVYTDGNGDLIQVAR